MGSWHLRSLCRRTAPLCLSGCVALTAKLRYTARTLWSSVHQGGTHLPLLPEFCFIEPSEGLASLFHWHLLALEATD